MHISNDLYESFPGRTAQPSGPSPLAPLGHTGAPRVLDNVLEAIGHTPLIAVNRIREEEGLKCRLLVKAEYLSAGGSIKDRVALRMIEAAEAEGRLTPRLSCIIEPTSGNTGVGLALACAVKGYRCIICLPEKMSQEKVIAMRALGAEVIRTPTSAPTHSPESNMGVAARLVKEIPHAVILDQFANAQNPAVHESSTAPEILDALRATYGPAARVDVVVGGAGTGGTLCGLARGLRSRTGEDLFVLGVDPVGSTLALPESLNGLGAQPYALEGIGFSDFCPANLDHSLVSSWIKVSDCVAFATTRRLIRSEGLLVGGSSGAAMAGVLAWLRETKEGRRIAETEGKNVVVVLPDGIRNYLSKPWVVE